MIGLVEDPNAGAQDKRRQYNSALVLPRLLPAPPARKRKPTVDELARLIREAHAAVVEFGIGARLVASVAIKAAVTCGGYLREAKLQTAVEKCGGWRSNSAAPGGQ